MPLPVFCASIESTERTGSRGGVALLHIAQIRESHWIWDRGGSGGHGIGLVGRWTLW